MTVTRRVEASFEAPDDETADYLADLPRRVLMGERWTTWRDLDRAETCRQKITGQAFASEPVVPSPEPLVEP